MLVAPVALYFNLARDGQPPVWLLVGRGWLQPDGSVQATLDHLPADGRIRLQLERTTGADRTQACLPPKLDGPSAPQRAACRPPPPPAARRKRRPQEVTPW